MTGKFHVPVRPYTLSELANGYGISNKTLKTFLKKHDQAIGERSGKYYTARQVKIIYEKLGLPGDF